MRWFLLSLMVFASFWGEAQISTFPYLQNFESTDGGWTSGGISDDWAWGHPSKSIINQAGSGQKCWITGGLTSSSYSNGERSFLESPTFNFSNLFNPYLEFKMYVETEQGYDGASLQYSTNNGTTWVNVGTINEPNSCFTNQWFNTASIVYLTGLSSIKEGWSGNSRSSSGGCAGGGGTLGWVTSKHCLKFLAGQAQVKFRFVFGAGTSCNAFDGFAFDDFTVKNAPTLGARFSYSCLSPGNFRFTDQSPNCPNQWSWDFGDGTTGSGNTINHSFSPGKYWVKLVAANACSQPDTFNLWVPVLGVQARGHDVGCSGGMDGSAKAFFVGIDSSKTWNISWNTNPPITGSDSIAGLIAGNYQVSISQIGTCTVSSNFSIQEPLALRHQANVIPTVCTAAKGEISVLESGGTAPYQFSWQPAVSSTNTGKSLAAGPYSIFITDAHGCQDTLLSNVPTNFKSLSVNLGKDTSLCPMEDTLTLESGTFFRTLWSNGSTDANLPISIGGTYFLLATDSDGCTGTDTIVVHEYCSEEMWVANAFSPDEDGWNDDFGGLTASPQNLVSFEMIVFNRWGEELFHSFQYNERWNGTKQGTLLLNGIYPFVILYQFKNGKPQVLKGSVSILR